MGGSTKVVDTTPKDITGLRSSVTKYLMGGGQGAGGGAGPTYGGGLPLGGTPGGPTIMPPIPGINFPTTTGGSPITTAGTGLDRISAGQTSIPTPGIVQEVNPGDIRSVTGQIDTSRVGNVRNDFTGIGTNVLPNIDRGMIRNIGPYDITPSGATSSVDQLGGARSAFFQNMINQLQPSFTNQRQLGLAAAKESAGNLTGTGFGNALGASVNRSLGDEQAALAGYATTGLQTEVQRQLADAQRRSSEGIAQGQLNLGTGQANQGADISFINQLLGRGQLGATTALDAARLGLQGDIANQGTFADLAKAQGSLGLQGQMANQTSDQFLNNLLTQIRTGNRDVLNSTNIAQAQLNSGTANENAQRFAQLLAQMSTTGVAPGQVIKSGGIGSILGPLGGLAGTVLGGPIGGAIGGAIFGNASAGGPRPGETAYRPV